MNEQSYRNPLSRIRKLKPKFSKSIIMFFPMHESKQCHWSGFMTMNVFYEEEEIEFVYLKGITNFVATGT